MQALNGTYAKKFNAKYERSGYLFEDRYKSILVDSENFALTLSKYIHLNPVKANLVAKPEDWKWSSYREMLGKAKPYGFLEKGFLQSFFSDDEQTAVTNLHSYTSFNCSEFDWEPESEIVYDLILGSGSFVKRIMEVQKSVDNFGDLSPSIREKYLVYGLKRKAKLPYQEIANYLGIARNSNSLRQMVYKLDSISQENLEIKSCLEQLV